MPPALETAIAGLLVILGYRKRRFRAARCVVTKRLQHISAKYALNYDETSYKLLAELEETVSEDPLELGHFGDETHDAADPEAARLSMACTRTLNSSHIGRLICKGTDLADKETFAPTLIVVPSKAIYQHFHELQEAFPMLRLKVFYGDPGSMPTKRIPRGVYLKTNQLKSLLIECQEHSDKPWVDSGNDNVKTTLSLPTEVHLELRESIKICLLQGVSQE
ncbi:hypothetical protein VFPPC_02162 [Pochonia chlamydosporia 170]|uniref:Uncharacterized protein n=1 Tax=Pochonia chlamydosporia 170 TaxID=1380566 RepID=A0A179F6R3_METCM|nr:hypothetical protein VFPPC_02162 [Pochonia chlamydosporia 170]OAQ61154.1 hypothetical protein VFPPC_02162 [Pochonia chlamydosporia 170]